MRKVGDRIKIKGGREMENDVKQVWKERVLQVVKGRKFIDIVCVAKRY